VARIWQRKFAKCKNIKVIIREKNLQRDEKDYLNNLSHFSYFRHFLPFMAYIHIYINIITKYEKNIEKERNKKNQRIVCIKRKCSAVFTAVFATYAYEKLNVKRSRSVEKREVLALKLNGLKKQKNRKTPSKLWN